MELQHSIRISDEGGQCYANINNCSFSINKTFSGYRLKFGFMVDSVRRKDNEKPVSLQGLQAELYFHQSSEKILLGQMLTEINYQKRTFAPDYKFSLRKDFYISTADFIRLVDQTYGDDVLFSFVVLPVLRNSLHEPKQETGWLKIPQTDWLEKINQLDLDRFELITIRVPVASSHLHRPFVDAVPKIREAENLYQKGEWHGAVAACRAAWNTVLSIVPSGTSRDERLEHLLAGIVGEPPRKEFALAVLKGFNNVVNKGVHLEGDVKTGTPPADLKREDVLLCIHWYSAAIGYLSSI